MSTISNHKMIHEVVAKFFINTLLTISGDTDYESIKKMVQYLYSNADTLPKTLDGVKHGHVDLIMKDTLCATLVTVTPW